MALLGCVDSLVQVARLGQQGFLVFDLMRRQYPCACLEWARGPFVTLAIDCQDHGDHVTCFEDDIDAMDQASDVLSGRLKL